MLTCMACRLCYVHTENDEAPVATATTASASLSGGSTLSPNPLNRTQLAALGGVPAVFACLHRAVTERARDAALSVLLDAACARVARLDPSSEAYLRGRESHRYESPPQQLCIRLGFCDAKVQWIRISTGGAG